MPLHGKIVVIKRSGGDGTEFPLTATCLFGRKPDCDIRIQLPQVSKEHCRIDLNENKEVILTNLSSVNPTRVNGEALQQSERLKHGDVITIIDRSFRFEYPPAPTPKKRSSLGGKTETFKVLQDQQVGDTISSEIGEKRISEVSTDPHLKDGTNLDNIQRSLEKTLEVESKEDDSLLQNKTASPFNDLYQMIKKSLDVKTPRKSSASLLQTPSSKICTPRPVSVRRSGGNSAIPTDKSTPKKDEAKVSGADEPKEDTQNERNGTPKSVKKQRKSFEVPSTVMTGPEDENPVKVETLSPQKRNRTPPQRFTVNEVIEQVSTPTPKSPVRRRSKEATPAKPAVTKEQDKQAVTSPKTKASPKTKSSPRNSGKVEKVKTLSTKRKSGELLADLPTPQMKKKRVSFGGHLSPELFDKRLPPDSPLRKGATPRRSLSLFKPKQSLLRRASVIGLLQEFDQEHSDSPKGFSPATRKTPSPGKKSPKSRSPSPKAATPAKKSPKSRSPSPKAATPAKKSPKSRSPSPKAATPAKKSPKSKSPSPKAATPTKKSPKSSSTSPKAATPAKMSPKSKSPSPKGATPAKKSPKSSSTSPKAATPAKSLKSKTPSPAKGRSPARNNLETPKANQQTTPGLQTPTVQGRFSVSRISTPSPVAEETVADQVPVVMVTPKIPLRRKSMKSTSRKSIVKSAVKVMRRSGISRASIKALNSYADIVKFGQTKAQVAPPAKAAVTKKTVKKAVIKPKTPARKLKGHVSTGHADSPATIVVGRAHKQKVVHPTGAAPRLVTNIALLKKNLKMDEDLTGISEMYKTPVNERKRRSVINENTAMKTPVVALGTSMVEPSVLNTPEEPGEMMVSPLSISSTVKDGRYNSEAVRRLLDGDQETGMVSDITTEETHSDGEQQGTDLTTTSVNTPKQKPELPECLTGVKRIMKTPRQKAEPVEDLRGKLLKTPKQKPEQQECLTGVKRIMKTPRQKAEPVEDLRGNILKTPKQKPQEHDCLTGVKQIFETPKWEAETVEDLEGKLLEAGDAVAETTAQMQASEDLSEMTDVTTPNTKSSPAACLTGVKRIMKTPKEKSAPVEDMLGVKRLMKTPKEKFESVEENFGIKRLVKTPRLRGKAPVEDFEGLKELMEEPVPEATEQLEPKEVEDQTPLDCDVDVAQALDFAHEEPQDDVKSDVIDDVPQVEMEQEADANEVVADESGHENKSSDASETQVTVDEISPMEELKVDTVDEPVSEEEPMVEAAAETAPEEQPKADVSLLEDEPKMVAVDDTGLEGEVEAVAGTVPEEEPNMDAVDEASEEQPKADAVDETVSEEPIVEAVDEAVTEEQPKVEAVSEEQPKIVETVPEEPAMEAVDETVMEKQPKVEKKSVRGRRAKSKPAEEEQEATEQSEDAVIPAPVRGRRGKKTEATAPPAVRQTTRGRNAKTTESMDAELAVEESAPVPSKVAPKPKRGRNAKKASDDQTEMVQEVSTETEMVPEPITEQSPPVDVDEVNDSAAPVEKVVVKPKRGRKTKQPEEAVPEQQDVPSTDSDDSPQADTEKEADANEVCSDQIEVLPSGGDENKSSDAMETVSQASVAERLPEEETSTCKEPVLKKSVRGRRVKMVKSKPADDKQEVMEQSQAVDEIVPEEQPKVAEPVPEEQPKVEAVDETVPEEQSKVEKKSGRGRRGKAVESKPAEEKQEVVEPSEDPVVAAPVRGRRGKKTEAAAPPAVRQTTRGRNAKSQSAPVEQPEMEPEKAVETQVTEVSSEAESDQTIVVKTLEEKDSAPPAEETVVKPVRGRKTKQTPVESQPEPEKTDASEEHLEADVEMPKSIPAAAKPRRGRKTKADTVEQNEVAEEAVVPVETKQESQPPVRAKRGRNAKQEEEKQENDDKTTSVETTQSQEPVKKSRRIKKVEQENAEPCVEAQSTEQADPEENEAPVVAEPVKMDEPAAVAAKPRRGGRKAKQDTETETPVEATKIQEVPAVSSDKPKRGGRRAKQITEEVEVTAVVPEDKPEPEAEEKNVALDAPVVKASRARGAKSEVPQAVPAKRARRGAASSAEETSADSSISDSAAPLVEPTKRGRRAAAKPTADDAAKEASEEVKPTEDSSSAVDEDKKNSKKSVKWKTNVEVYEIPKPTPVKAGRGRKSKLANQVDTEIQNVSEDASKTEEKDLSDTVAEAQPAKRVRRGAKTADKEESTSEAETQPKTRRGRSAKK